MPFVRRLLSALPRLRSRSSVTPPTGSIRQLLHRNTELDLDDDLSTSNRDRRVVRSIALAATPSTSTPALRIGKLQPQTASIRTRSELVSVPGTVASPAGRARLVRNAVACMLLLVAASIASNHARADDG